MEGIRILELLIYLFVHERDDVFTHTCTWKSSETVQSDSTSSLVLPHFRIISRHFQDFLQTHCYPAVNIYIQQWQIEKLFFHSYRCSSIRLYRHLD